ncbi:hypothetical protein IU450_38065 [Nocardia abscessus]|uniref:hypothetical protein n=1 Tax=Nocardia abscessus TaxID=120957 RepID=UPI0018950C30|nr:hypothetical protein [Nocardia abscessus]MBF6341643.1 hypothetical protein [Nocardia abscessus]
MRPDICPACQSTHAVVSLRAVHQQGTGTIETHSTHTGFGVTSSGGLLPVTGTTSTVAVHTTALAAQTAPAPAQRSTAGPIALALVGVVAFMLTFPLFGLVLAEEARQGGDVVVKTGICLAVFGSPAVLGFLIAAVRARANRRIARSTPTALEVWHNSWYCGRCGGCFVPYTKWPDALPARQLMAPRDYQQRLWRIAGFR